MKRTLSMTIIAIALTFTFIYGQAQEKPMEIYCKHFFFGYPIGTPKTNDLIIRDIYALSNNDQTKFADWVAFRVSITDTIGECDQTRVWRTDPWLDKSETLDASGGHDAYKGANKALKVDRGHQAPLASFQGTMHWYQTNFYSNITPQKSELNEGPWMRMEEMERELAQEFWVIYVMTGPLYERDMPKMPNVTVEHKIPSGYWRIIIVPKDEKDNKNFDTVSFIFDQETGRDEKVLPHLTTIRTIEKKTGLNFLWLLDEATQNKVETVDNRKFAETYFKEE